LLSLAFQSNPHTSFLIAWVGSIFNIFFVVKGYILPLPNDLSFKDQLFRPVFLSQLLFVGYMALTSIFFYLDVIGYKNFIKPLFFHINYTALEETASSQRIYSLAHAAYSSGLLILMKYKKNPFWEINTEKVDANFFLKAAILFTVLKFVFLFVPGLSQFSIKSSDLAYISSIVALLYKSENKKLQFYIIALLFFLINFVQILFSGWKEPIIFTLIVFAAFLYPRYKKTVSIISVPVFFLILVFLPSFNSVFRSLSWSEGVESTVAAQVAIDAIQSGEVDIYEDNWSFLVARVSEVSMFNDYKRKVPKEIDYYGFSIISNSFKFILPRLFWPDKPDIEEHVMKRVYEIGVVSQQMEVSAKPPLVVDAYLSGGPVFVFVFMLLFGLFTSYISTIVEYLFCGYNLGSTWVFIGLFQILNRGNCMEFFVNAVFWGVISMFILLFFLKKLNYIIPKSH
jgi:hypothetical protein